MSQPSVSVDSRDRMSKLSRRQALDILRARGVVVKNENIPLGTGIPTQDKGPTLLKIMENEGIDHMDPFPEVGWHRVEATDENGRTVSTDMPIRPQHQSAGENINYDQEIANAAQKHADDAEVIAEQTASIESLMSRLQALETQVNNAIPMHKATIPQLKGIAKSRGIKFEKTVSKSELLALLGE